MTKSAKTSALSAIGRLIATVRKNISISHKINGLQYLTDQQLDDIGLTRSDVRRAYGLSLFSDRSVALKEAAAANQLARHLKAFPIPSRAVIPSSAPQNTGTSDESKHPQAEQLAA